MEVTFKDKHYPFEKSSMQSTGLLFIIIIIIIIHTRICQPCLAEWQQVQRAAG